MEAIGTHGMPEQRIVYCYINGDLIVNQTTKDVKGPVGRKKWPHLIDEDGNMKKCPRCGKKHLGVTVYEFRRSVIAPDTRLELFDGWTVCPETCEPILVRSGEGPERVSLKVVKEVRDSLPGRKQLALPDKRIPNRKKD